MGINFGLYRFEFKAIPLVVTLLVVVVCAKLGFWQLQRAQDKAQRLSQIAQYQQYDAMSFAQLVEFMTTHEPTGVNVSVEGQFIAPYSWLLDNKIVNGQPGYDVLLAFSVNDTERPALVNMGWIKADYAKRSELPKFSIPTGEQTFKAYVKAKDLSSFVLSEQSDNTQQWPTRTQQINLPQFEKDSGLRFLPLVLYAEPVKDWGFTHHYQPVVMQPAKHRAYALQWFLLALAAIIVFIFASRSKIEDKL